MGQHFRSISAFTPFPWVGTGRYQTPRPGARRNPAPPGTPMSGSPAGDLTGLVFQLRAHEQRDPGAVGLPVLADPEQLLRRGRPGQPVGERDRASQPRLLAGHGVGITRAADRSHSGLRPARPGKVPSLASRSGDGKACTTRPPKLTGSPSSSAILAL